MTKKQTTENTLAAKILRTRPTVDIEATYQANRRAAPTLAELKPRTGPSG
jgi:hypothetical protein